MASPIFLQDEAFKLLRSGEVAQFHRAIESRDVVDLTGAELRGTDFRKVQLDKLILRDTYLRDTDFRGCDLRHLDLEGASIHNARISGTYFPANLDAEEIQMSLEHGTRLRTREG